MRKPFAIAALVSLAPPPAAAHPGDHGHMSLLQIVQHYAEPDHLAFLALTVLVGVAAFRWGRRIESKARSASRPGAVDQRRDPS